VSTRGGLVLERLAIAVASLALSVFAIALLSGYFAGNDQAGVTGAANVPGQTFPDLGHEHLPPGRLRPPYNSIPPTSGAHVPQPVTQDDVELNDNQLLQALELGNVVVLYGGGIPPPGLQALARMIEKGPFSPALAASGGAVILARSPGTNGLIGLAWTHMIRVNALNVDPLGEFAQYYLGKGAPGR
jgi:hypothetical protein